METVITNVKAVLAESYPNAEFTISDAGSKMEAASKSNDTLTMLLICMAVIVFIVGGIGIMNVLFVSVKERTMNRYPEGYRLLQTGYTGGIFDGSQLYQHGGRGAGSHAGSRD